MRSSLNLLLPGLVLAVHLASSTALGQTPHYRNVGRTPSPEEIRAGDISVGTEGKELPPGSGTAQQGAQIYAQKCVACHGQNGEGGPGPRLVGAQGTLEGLRLYAFATTLWDVINRNMPLDQGGSLHPDEVYALTAHLLYRNSIIPESQVLDARNLPKIQMPARDHYLPLRLEDIHDPRKRGCRLGTCP